MSSTNQSPQYQKAESMFLSAKTDNERLTFLEEMIRECPKHKSSEKMLSQLKIRLKKLKEKIEKSKKKGKSSKVGIKKEEMQAVIIGFSNVGKSSLLSILTKAEPKIEEYKFTTKEPIIGMVDFKGSNIQLIESPSIESNYYNPGVTNTADTLILVVDSIQQIEKIEENIKKASKKRIIIFNDKNKNDLRKISSTLSTKKYNYLIKNLKDILKNIEEKRIDIEEIKEKIFLCFGKKRVFTKEPGKEKSKKPIILESDSDVYEVAKKILKNIGDLKETKIWGPSSKFPGQKVGLKHILKDLDIIEFKTK